MGGTELPLGVPSAGFRLCRGLFDHRRNLFHLVGLCLSGDDCRASGALSYPAAANLDSAVLSFRCWEPSWTFHKPGDLVGGHLNFMNNSDRQKSILLPEAYLHYDQIDEASRLTGIGGQLELLRTRELMRRFLPNPPATIIDVGGGAGIHAFWLAEQGFNVTLIDAVSHHIETAKKNAQERPNVPLRMEVGDARSLNVDDSASDAVLLFGPLYHLTSREDRVKCIAEARRVLRPGGIVMGVGIPRFASLVNCLSLGEAGSSVFRSIVDTDLQDGQHRNPTDDPTFFTTTFFHHPDELVDEFKDGGFEVQHLLAVEGPGKLIPDLEKYWSIPEQQEWILEVIRKVECEPHLFGVSTHLMAIGK